MFILGLNLITDGVFGNALPPKSSYDSVTFYGNENAEILDGIHMKAYEQPDSEILAVNSEELFFETETIFLANFEHNLEAGTISNSDNPITNWVVRRKRSGDTLNPIVAVLPYNPIESNYVDYEVGNRINYLYTVSPVSGSGNNRVEGRGVEGGSILDFFGWTLSSIEATPTIYKFDLEIDSDNISVVTDFKLYEGYTRFPIARFGEMEYRKGKLDTIPYAYNEVDGTYTIDTTLLNNIIAFINDKNVKILKMPSGETFKVVTTEASYKYYDKIAEQPYKLSFSFLQVGDVTN